MVSLAKPQTSRTPDGEQERKRNAGREEYLGCQPRIWESSSRYKHGGNTNQSDKTALNGMSDFAECLIARQKPLQNIQKEKRRPNNRCKQHEGFPDD
jgi:hypothetical protein